MSSQRSIKLRAKQYKQFMFFPSDAYLILRIELKTAHRYTAFK